jgi:thiol-disulfide isomerase/thioredoxin
MLKTTLFSTLFIFGLFFQGCSSDDTKKTKIDAAKANNLLASNEIVLKDTHKQQYILKKTPQGYKLKGAEDKILLLNIFATWCPPCRAEASHLSSLAQKYKDKLIILGVTIEDGIEDGIEDEKLEIFKKEYNANYPIVNSAENDKLITDLTKKLKFGRDFGIPLLVLLKNGEIIHFFQGATEEEFIESEIKKALENK